jgi:ribosome-binding factor A
MPDRRYPRTARVNNVLREVVADALEKVSDEDERLVLVTITAIDVDPDLRHAKVFYASRQEGVEEALDEQRVRLQAAIGRQVRLKRTPQLSFVADPAVSSGERLESILRQLNEGQGQLKNDDSD